MTNIEFVKGKLGVEIKGDYYNAHPLPYDVGLMIVDEAYMVGNIVMPFYGNTEGVMRRPGFYSVNDSDGEIQLVINEPNNSERKYYNADNIVALELDKLIERINSEDFMSPEEVERINMNSEFRVFEINPDDDFLKVIVKTIINTKKVNLKIYTDRLPERHSLGNMISSLSGKTKMSVSYFQIWRELLGFDFNLTVIDSGIDTIAPLKEDIVYDGTSGEIDTSR